MARDPLFLVVVVAVALVAGILLLGIGGFGSGRMSGARANRIMRWRIGAQAVAVALILFYVWLRRG